MTDPTGTAGLRRAFLAEGNRRLARVRSLTHAMLVEHDLLHARNEPVAQLLGHPGQRLALFTDWFERVVNAQLLGGFPAWWERYLVRAYQSGLAAGSELVKVNGTPPPPGRSSLPAVYRESASQELAGIAAALLQQVSRQAAGAAIGRQKPKLLYRAVLGAIRKVGEARLKAFINFMVVKLHNAARLEQFRGAGIEEVGIVPELLAVGRPSRFVKHDHFVGDRSAGFVNVLTAGDDLVCIVCQDISEQGPYPVDEAEGLIPAHPNCRCAFIPADDMRFALNRAIASGDPEKIAEEV